MPDPSTPAALMQEHYAAIRELNAQVDRAHAEWEASKEETAAKKKDLERLHGDLRRLIRNPDDQLGLPFGDADWRCRSLRVLPGLTDALVDKLAEAGLETLGHLKDYWDGGKYLEDLKGVGPEKSSLITDAFADYAKEHPEVYGEPEEADDDAPPELPKEGP